MVTSRIQSRSPIRILLTLFGALLISGATTSELQAQRGGGSDFGRSRGDSERSDRGGSPTGGSDLGAPGGGFGGGFPGGGFPGGGFPGGGFPGGGFGGDRSSFGGDSGRSRDDSSGQSSDRRSRSRDAVPVVKVPRPRVTVDLPAAYAALDTDRDGQLGLYEWSRGDLARFQTLDRNRDGFLTPRELVAPASPVASPGPATTSAVASR